MRSPVASRGSLWSTCGPRPARSDFLYSLLSNPSPLIRIKSRRISRTCGRIHCAARACAQRDPRRYQFDTVNLIFSMIGISRVERKPPGRSNFACTERKFHLINRFFDMLQAESEGIIKIKYFLIFKWGLVGYTKCSFASIKYIY